MPDPDPTPAPAPTPTPETPPTPAPSPEPTPTPAAQVVAPEPVLDYSGLVAPDILHMEAADLEAVRALAAQHKLPPEAVGELIGKVGEQQQRLLEAYNVEAEAAQKKQGADWLVEAKADPTIGGQAFDANYALANTALNKFADEPFRKWLDETGFRNFPPFLRMFHAVAKATAEAPLITGTPTPSPVDQYKALYPNSPALWAENRVSN